MSRMLSRVRIGVILLLMSLPATGVRAQSDDAPTGQALEALTSQVASQLRCPVCRSLSIEDSSSDLAKEARSLIHERLAAGESPDEVKAYFVAKYGEWILLSPPKRGFTLLVWLLPVGAVLVGGAILVRVLRGWLPTGEAGSSPPPPERAVP